VSSLIGLGVDRHDCFVDASFGGQVSEGFVLCNVLACAPTTIHGLKIDPFYYVPETTIDMHSGERGSNLKTLAELVLLVKVLNNVGRQSTSPVTRVTVSSSLK
jgi:hypothetical protein